ncbi:MAG: UDP-N-acetylmuramoyl-L-alanine--D-glutamate ligase [Prevotellaceae bacterium]|jgi:UDP-N-acetylmuramoylalanine--D-glutamate ligase|nr:UDP-N-acetylmuramoyl-L-alanine--D-glutamate ligase [Prevotellaceae bacterium]
MKKLIILGAGESGVGTAILAQKKGYDVFVSDLLEIKDEYRKTLIDKGIKFEEKTHEKALNTITNYELRITGEDASNSQLEVVKSPGIPDKAPIIKHLKEKKIPIISEIEFASRYTNAKKICITGSNGKTTTTMLTYFILKNAGLNVGLAGNVGKSFARQVAENDFDYYVLELSSFQLDGMYDFRADVSVILNITPDHLDRYDYQFQNYIDAKFRILQNQTAEDAFIFWNDDDVLKKEIEKRDIKAQLFPFAECRSKARLAATGDAVETQAFTENENLIINSKNPQNTMVMELEKILLRGTHNLYNSMAAGLAAQLANISKENIRRSLENFTGVEHRMEYVASVRGVRYINDSKATNVNSAWYALKSMQTPVVLILGGTDKGNDYTEIESLTYEKARSLIFLGVDNEKLKNFFSAKERKRKIPFVEVKSMQDAVAAAYDVAKHGDTVLLSPCCASFDLFQNYEDRGRQFKENVRKL